MTKSAVIPKRSKDYWLHFFDLGCRIIYARTYNSANVFGQATLSSADTIPVGKRYRVTLQVFSSYTPINLSGVSLNWGATIGTHICDIRMERIGRDSRIGNSGFGCAFLRPPTPSTGQTTAHTTTAVTLDTTAWEDDAGFTSFSAAARPITFQAAGLLFDAAYSAGTYFRTRTLRWAETTTITAATLLFCTHMGSTTSMPSISIKPQTGSISKPNGWRMELAFPIHWTRVLVN